MESWYFSRTELADHYLKIFDIGISSNIAIFAPRRRGKTLFLLKDIAPLAQEKNYIPIYTSFWLNPNAPHEPFLLYLQPQKI